jgi:hypothetical protein
MRQLADENHMYLSQHRLHVGVIRMVTYCFCRVSMSTIIERCCSIQGKNKVNEGRLVPTPTEESIFHYLKLPYRSPSERDY